MLDRLPPSAWTGAGVGRRGQNWLARAALAGIEEVGGRVFGWGMRPPEIGDGLVGESAVQVAGEPACPSNSMSTQVLHTASSASSPTPAWLDEPWQTESAPSPPSEATLLGSGREGQRFLALGSGVVAERHLVSPRVEACL